MLSRSIRSCDFLAGRVKGHKYVMRKYRPANHILMGDGSSRDALIGYSQTGDMVCAEEPERAGRDNTTTG